MPRQNKRAPTAWQVSRDVNAASLPAYVPSKIDKQIFFHLPKSKSARAPAYENEGKSSFFDLSVRSKSSPSATESSTTKSPPAASEHNVDLAIRAKSGRGPAMTSEEVIPDTLPEFEWAEAQIKEREWEENLCKLLRAEIDRMDAVKAAEEAAADAEKIVYFDGVVCVKAWMLTPEERLQYL